MEDFASEVNKMSLADIKLILEDQLDLYSDSEIQILRYAYENKLQDPNEINADPAWVEEIDFSPEDDEETYQIKISKEEDQSILLAKKIQVTTTDIHNKYEIIAPIIYNTTNRGVFSSLYKKLLSKYKNTQYEELLSFPSLSPQTKTDGMALLTLFDLSAGFEGTVGQQSFDLAFYMSIAEMKLRASELGGNAIVGLKIDFDLDTTNFGCFYLQMYGTVVKRLDSAGQ